MFACLAQLYTSEEKADLVLKSDDKSDNKLEDEGTYPVDEDKTLEALKYFVYPTKYSNIPMFNNSSTSRNITIDKINYQPIEQTSVASVTSAESLYRIIDDPADYRQNAPNSYYNYDGYNQPQQGFQPHLLNQGSSMVHLVDPLFVMATLAFVVFLINSILGLVSKLPNLPIIGSNRNQPLNEIDDGERDRMNDEVLDEIEKIIKNALFEFKKHSN